MIIHMKYKPPQIGSITVNTEFLMVTQEESDNYKIIYKEAKGNYKAVYNVASFEVLYNG